jgi:hypothetical protein
VATPAGLEPATSDLEDTSISAIYEQYEQLTDTSESFRAHFAQAIPKTSLRAAGRRYGGPSRSTLVPAYLIEIATKVVVVSELAADGLCDNIYSRIEEFVPSDDHILDLELSALPLPDWNGAGPSDLGEGTGPEEGGEAPVP